MAEKSTNNDIDQFSPHLRPVLESSLESMEFLTQLTQEDSAMIPEPIFAEHVLPVLANRKGNQSLEVWQKIAGHTMRSLTVFDPNTGEILFKVPPLLRQISNAVKPSGGRSLSQVAMMTDKKRQVLPAMGDRYFESNVVNHFEHTPADREQVVAWDNVLKRYGYPGILKQETSEKVSEDNQERERESLSDMIEGFDDL